MKKKKEYEYHILEGKPANSKKLEKLLNKKAKERWEPFHFTFTTIIFRREVEITREKHFSIA